MIKLEKKLDKPYVIVKKVLAVLILYFRIISQNINPYI